MEQTSRTKRVPRRARSLPAGRRPFLTPAVWKQAQPGVPKPRKGSRWSFHHLTLVLLAMTWSRGESTPERFERARGIVAICRPKRRRPGRTPQGVPKALVRLLRLSSKVRRFGDRPVAPDRFAQGEVWDWPRDAQGKGLPPWRLRLIRVSGRRKGQGRGQTVDVGLLTHGPGRAMSLAQAGRFSRLRWANEGLFRTSKRTLSTVRLVGRTVRGVQRAAYDALLACQLLRAQGTWALRPRRGARAAASHPCSARRAIRVIRAALVAAMRPDRRVTDLDRLGRCARERRERTSAKQKREWPRRTPHKPPKPPKLLTMNEEEKALYSRLNAVA